MKLKIFPRENTKQKIGKVIFIWKFYENFLSSIYFLNSLEFIILLILKVIVIFLASLKIKCVCVCVCTYTLLTHFSSYF